MRLGVNVPNFGPGTDPGILREWGRRVEGWGFEALMVSDHLVVTPDVAQQYPAPFYEPFTTLAWFAGSTRTITLGTTVVVLPYRHPLQVARSAANLQELSGGRLVLGVGVGRARQEFATLGVDFERRGRLTDQALADIRAAWRATEDYGRCAPPIWVGGNSAAALRRAVRWGDAWHPIHLPASALPDAAGRLATAAAGIGSAPQFAPRLQLRLTGHDGAADRLAGVGELDQVCADLAQLRALGASWAVLDTFIGDMDELASLGCVWADLAQVAEQWYRAPVPAVSSSVNGVQS